jgi:hypothetical protein
MARKKKKPDMHQCPFCQGKGQIELNGVYAETLDELRVFTESGMAMVANRDADHMGCEPTALSNRLKRLEEMGFARSEWYGRQRRYYATDTEVGRL